MMALLLHWRSGEHSPAKSWQHPVRHELVWVDNGLEVRVELIRVELWSFDRNGGLKTLDWRWCRATMHYTVSVVLGYGVAVA